MLKKKKKKKEVHVRDLYFLFLFISFLYSPFKSCQKLDGIMTEYTTEPSRCLSLYLLLLDSMKTLLQMKPWSLRFSQSPNHCIIAQNHHPGTPKRAVTDPWRLVSDHNVTGDTSVRSGHLPHLRGSAERWRDVHDVSSSFHRPWKARAKQEASPCLYIDLSTSWKQRTLWENIHADLKPNVWQPEV